MASGGVRKLLLPVLLLLFSQSSFAILFEVEANNKSCIMADLSVDFSVRFSTTGGKEDISNFKLPADAKLHKNSTCGNENGSAPLLAVTFGADHILSMSFNKTTTLYSVVQLTFFYNMSDSSLFRNSTRNGTAEVVSKKTGIFAPLNTTYRCNSVDLIAMDHVNVSFHNIKIEAYLPLNNFSAKESACSMDVTPTAAPTANSTTARPTTPMPPAPTVGTYNVTDENQTCLLISAGLQLNITYMSKANKTKMDVFDLDPLLITHTGHCKPSPTIIFSTTFTTLNLGFVENSTSKFFYLGSVAVKTTLPPDAQAADFATNGTTFYLKATVGNSYKCKSKQTLVISKEFSINTFNLQVQAFNVTGGKFGAVEECQLDENSMLVPIIVGAALAGLVLIVLVAYLIGRKRSHAGYQTI